MRKWGLFISVIGLVLTLAACGGGSSTSKNLAQLKENYPQLEEQLEGIPEEQLEEVKLPEYVPFQVKDVQVITSSEDSSQFEVIYTNGQMNLHVMTLSHSGTLFPEDTGIDLENGIHARYQMNQFGNELQWSNADEKQAYVVKLMAYPPSQPAQFTKEEVVKVANSMYKM